VVGFAVAEIERLLEDPQLWIVTDLNPKGYILGDRTRPEQRLHSLGRMMGSPRPLQY
jgi:hypothetical protein